MNIPLFGNNSTVKCCIPAYSPSKTIFTEFASKLQQSHSLESLQKKLGHKWVLHARNKISRPFVVLHRALRFETAPGWNVHKNMHGKIIIFRWSGPPPFIKQIGTTKMFHWPDYFLCSPFTFSLKNSATYDSRKHNPRWRRPWGRKSGITSRTNLMRMASLLCMMESIIMCV